jgi:ankyrin repeat protein
MNGGRERMLQKRTMQALKRFLFVSFLIAGFTFVCVFPAAAGSKNDRIPDLARAIRDGQNKKFNDLIKRNTDVNVADDYGWTALMYAIFQKDSALVGKLLSCGAAVNTQDHDGITPLLAAIMQAPLPFMIPYLPDSEKRGADIILMLIEKGADPNLADREGHTPLIYALSREQESTIAALIKKGADVHRSDNYGRTPLSFVDNPDKAAEWAPADGALSSSLRMRRIPSDESHFPPAYAAAVAEARKVASVVREETKKRIASLIRSAGATAPEATEIKAAGSHLIDARPQRLDLGIKDPLNNVLANYFRTSRKEAKYHMLARVSANGTVGKVLVLCGMPDGTGEKLKKAALKLKYQPAMKDGQPVEEWDAISGFVRTFNTSRNTMMLPY